MTLNPPTNATAPADIVKGSLAQWIRYGKVTTRMTAPAVPGIVTTFITMSETGDEIDWEAVGGDAQTIQTNIFYKGIVEFNVHGGKHAVANIETAHTYVIDWKSTGITFSIDDKVVRETTPAKETAASAMTPPGEQWFPKTPSMVQFSLWQADSEWAGGKVNWATAPKVQSTIDSITVECYDDNDEPVAFWPPAAKLRATTPVENAAQPSGSKTNGGSSGGSTGGSTGSGDKKGGSLPDGSVSGASSTALSAFFSVGSALAALAFLS
ncbi:concanavalin A-like lectin/glucanase domain-containing protein [Phlyctochytrium arcticum]|nr:concanavalin A-like lectin/glucanase domain-containing protein [Phlyctochytrium arcticum]